MILKSFKGLVGALNAYTNTYLVYDEKTMEGILIDIANNLKDIKEYSLARGIKLKYLLLTHCHADHIAGLKGLKDWLPNIKVCIHELDANGLIDDTINLSTLLEAESNFIEADIVVKDGDKITLGETTFEIIHTPGHTAGSISILVEDALFSGDTLFHNGTGRADFPTGNQYDMISSVRRLLELPENSIVYPGHNEPTIIQEEKKFYS